MANLNEKAGAATNLKPLADYIVNRLIQAFERLSDTLEDTDGMGDMFQKNKYMFSISRKQFANFCSKYEGAMITDHLPIYAGYYIKDGTLASYCEGKMVVSYEYLREIVEAINDGDKQKYFKGVSDLTSVILHELTHMVNEKSIGRNVISRIGDEETQNKANYIFYLYKNTEMNARLSEAWAKLAAYDKMAVYSRLKASCATNGEIIDSIIGIVQRQHRLSDMRALLKKVEECNVVGVQPFDNNNLVLNMIKAAHGHSRMPGEKISMTNDSINCPCIEYILGKRERLDAETWVMNMINASGDKKSLDDLKNDESKRFIYPNVPPQEVIDKRMAQAKDTIVKSMKKKCDDFYAKLAKMAAMWIEPVMYPQKKKESSTIDPVEKLLRAIYGEPAVQLRESDIRHMVERSLTEILKKRPRK